MSPLTNFILLRTSAILEFLPLELLSKIMTLCPNLINNLQIPEPINPVPPVTKKFFFFIIIFTSS